MRGGGPGGAAFAGALLLMTAGGSLAFAPSLPRLSGAFAAAGLLLVGASALRNRRAWKGLLLSLRGRRAARGLGRLALALAALTGAGALTSLPAWNAAAPEEAVLPRETLDLLARLDRDVEMVARVAPGSPADGPARHLMGLYAQASPRIRARIENAQGSSMVEDGGDVIRLATQDTVTITSPGFEETVSPVGRRQIDAAVRRLVSPPRLVYCLMAAGAKSAGDTGPRGLSHLARHLGRRGIYVRDWEWGDGRALPRAADALVLAGPRMPLDGRQGGELLRYLEGGGKLMSLNDPLVAALPPDLFAPLDLWLPEGLAVDQSMSWAGTEDSFVLSTDFPAHPATMGMREPVIFPLAGAVFVRGPAAQGQGAAGPGVAEGAAGAGAHPPGFRQRDPGGGTPPAGGAAAPGEGGPGGAAPEVPESLRGHTWATSLTSEAAFLETDRASVGRREPHFDRESDPLGPLVLASATTLAGGGRLVLAADSDFMSNSYIGFAGNLAFATGLVSWLVGSEDDLAEPRRGSVLLVTDGLARLFFWGPVVFWPLLVLTAWGTFFLRRRRAAA